MPSNKENEQSSVSTSDIKDLIQTLRDQAPPRKVAYANRVSKSSFAKGKKSRERKKLTRTFYQNGYRANPKMMTDDEIEAVNKLTPGRFAGGLLIVKVVESTGTDPDRVELHYSNKTPDQRMAQMQLLQGGGNPRRVQICVEEAEARKAARAAQTV